MLYRSRKLLIFEAEKSDHQKKKNSISERSEQKHFESEIVDVQNKIFDSSTSGELGEGQMFYNNNMSCLSVSVSMNADRRITV